jgi:hypothetical protein
MPRTVISVVRVTASMRGRAGMRAARRATTTTERVPQTRRAAAAEEAGPGPVDPAFHRAILKIALELKKPSAESYDAIVERTIRTMRLDAAAFRRYLGENGARNMSLLLATARGPGL